MKKFGMLLVGIIIGAGLTLSPQIYGAGAKLLGAKVDKTLDVKLNGASIGQGAVIDGTSYLPVRAAANALGLGVNVDSTQVNLLGTSSEENARIAQEQQAAADKVTKINDLKIFIKASKNKISGYELAIEFSESEVVRLKGILDDLANNNKGDPATRASIQERYDDTVTALTNNKAALDAEQQNLADLEAQLAELQK